MLVLTIYICVLVLSLNCDLCVCLASYTGSSSEEDDVNPREKSQVYNLFMIYLFTY